MNIVELLIFCAACEIIDKREKDPIHVTHAEYLASFVVAHGMKLSGFRWRPGILQHPWAPDLYNAEQAVEMLKLKNKGWQVGDLAFSRIRPVTYTNQAN